MEPLEQTAPAVRASHHFAVATSLPQDSSAVEQRRPRKNAVLLRRLEVSFSQPWVVELWARYSRCKWNIRERTPRLTFFVRPVRRAGDPGIDEVLLVSSGETPLARREYCLGSAAE